MTAATRKGAGVALDRYELEVRGAHRFKNVSDAVELYALTLAAQGERSQLPVDPVCRMAVDPDRSGERRTYDDVEYHFCSGECAEVFEHDPARYADGGLFG
jgi:YHS domain-containing protein